MARYVADPTAAEWEGFRDHFPFCEECAEQLAEWTGLEETLREKAGEHAGHPKVEALVALREDPNSLSQDVRSSLASHLASCPSCADEVAALRGYDFAARREAAASAPSAVDALKKVGRSLQELVPALFGRGDADTRGGGLPGAEPQVVFQSSDAKHVESGAETPGRPLVAVLAAVEGDLDGQVYRLVSGDNRIGRAPDCEVRLAGDVSRVEATIREQGGRFEVISGNRRRAVRVNDAEQESGPLADGDRVQVGAQRFQFRVVGTSG